MSRLPCRVAVRIILLEREHASRGMKILTEGTGAKDSRSHADKVVADRTKDNRRSSQKGKEPGI